MSRPEGHATGKHQKQEQEHAQVRGPTDGSLRWEGYRVEHKRWEMLKLLHMGYMYNFT